MDDTTTTFVGRVATPVIGRTLPGGSYKASFRLASSERRFDQAAGQWRDGRQLFMTVVVWRKLAEHVALSLQVGDPVMAHGRIFSRDYDTKDGRSVTVIEMEASALGPDLTWCTATVSRSNRAGNALVHAASGGGLATESATAGGPDDGWPDDVGDESDADIDGSELEEIETEIRAHEAAVGV
ncbi:MAG: hypothetical protein NVSMB4_07220 [Acidimicrobiales bacterium]